MSAGTNNNREKTTYVDASDYNVGQNIGDVISIVLGGLEFGEGAGTAVGGAAIAVGSDGVLSVPGAAVAVAGVAEASHGILTGTNAVRNLMSQNGRAGTTIAKENGVTVKSHGTNDAHKPAHAHVEGGGETVRVGPNGKPLKGEPELTSKQNKVIKNNIKDIRKEVNKVGKENKKIEDQKNNQQ